MLFVAPKSTYQIEFCVNHLLNYGQWGNENKLIRFIFFNNVPILSLFVLWIPSWISTLKGLLLTHLSVGWTFCKGVVPTMLHIMSNPLTNWTFQPRTGLILILGRSTITLHSLLAFLCMAIAWYSSLCSWVNNSSFWRRLTNFSKLGVYYVTFKVVTKTLYSSDNALRTIGTKIASATVMLNACRKLST